MKKKKYRYWCISKIRIYWIDSSSILEISNSQQMDWLKRNTDETVFLCVYLPKENTKQWTNDYTKFLDWVLQEYKKQVDYQGATE